jgi:hypothetical protein
MAIRRISDVSLKIGEQLSSRLEPGMYICTSPRRIVIIRQRPAEPSRRVQMKEAK